MTWLHGDGLGSVNVTTNGSGNKTSELRYTPYGIPRIASGNTPTNRQFTGMPSNDGGTGLVWLGARQYDPVVGRFVSADTMVPGAGNPQALNRYAYALNRPLNLIDPTGHFGEKPNKSSFCQTFALFCGGDGGLLEKEQTATTVDQTETKAEAQANGTVIAAKGEGQSKLRETIDKVASKLGLCKGLMAFICSEAARKAAEKVAEVAENAQKGETLALGMNETLRSPVSSTCTTALPRIACLIMGLHLFRAENLHTLILSQPSFLCESAI